MVRHTNWLRHANQNKFSIQQRLPLKSQSTTTQLTLEMSQAVIRSFAATKSKEWNFLSRPGIQIKFYLNTNLVQHWRQGGFIGNSEVFEHTCLENVRQESLRRSQSRLCCGATYANRVSMSAKRQKTSPATWQPSLFDVQTATSYRAVRLQPGLHPIFRVLLQPASY